MTPFSPYGRATDPTASVDGSREPTYCTQHWIGDDERVRFCNLARGHKGECKDAEGHTFSQTVEES